MIKSRLVIIEDEFFVANHLSDLVEASGHRVLDIYYSGEDFLEQTDWNFDAAIVDIFLSKKSTGIEVAQQLKKRQKPFIFLTANEDSRTLKQAARLSPKAYLSKPFKPNDVIAALEIVVHQLSPKIQIRRAHGIELLSANEILFIKGDGAYIEIHTVDEVILQRKLLKEIEVKLPHEFTRVHRSYLVNQNYMKCKTANYLLIRDEKIPISKGYRNLI